MKMRDLVNRTGVSKEKIHYFKREKMLPPAEKPNPNQAIYNEKHVERILLIQDLQDKYFIPIPIIKEIIKQLETSPFEEELVWIKARYFQPTDHFLPQEIIGENKFLEFTGIKADRLKDFEDYGIICPVLKDNVKIFNHDSVKLGRIFGDMRISGLGHERGFSKILIKEIHGMLETMVYHTIAEMDKGFKKAAIQGDEIKCLSTKVIEYFSIILYHMGHTLFEEAVCRYLDEKPD